MGVALLIPMCVLLVLVVLVLAARLSAVGVLDNWGLDLQTRADRRMAADAEDMRQLLELDNRRRRDAGLDELTEDELRFGAGF